MKLPVTEELHEPFTITLDGEAEFESLCQHNEHHDRESNGTAHILAETTLQATLLRRQNQPAPESSP